MWPPRFRSRGEDRGIGEDLCTRCSNTSWLETDRRLRLVAGLSPASVLIDSESELRRIGDNMLAPRLERSATQDTRLARSCGFHLMIRIDMCAILDTICFQCSVFSLNFSQ